MDKHKKIWTVGHSTRTTDDFRQLLHSFEIEQLVDVRRFPSSRKFPQFNADTMASTLLDNGIVYTHLETLGGRRKARPDSKNTIWNHPSFRGYADYMESREFMDAFEHLESLAVIKKSAIMCSEAVWWRCHRSMISDQLKANAWEVVHIMGQHQHQEHPYTKPAKLENGQLSYH